MYLTPPLPRRSGPAFHARLVSPRRLAVAAALLGTLALGAATLLRPSPDDILSATGSLTLPVGRQPTAMAVDARNGHIFVANYGDATLSMLDIRRGTTIRTIALGQHPLGLAIDAATERIFTLNTAAASAPLSYPSAAAASISVLDARTGTLLSTELPGAQPSALAVDERRGRVFVLNSGDSTLSLLDARSGGVLATVTLGGMPQALTVDTQAGCVYVGTNGDRGRLLVLDSRSGRRLRTLTPGLSVGAVLAVPAAGRVVVAGDGVLRLFTSCGRTLLRTIRAAVVPLLAGGRDARRILVTGMKGLRLLDARTGRWCGPWALQGWNLPPIWSEDAANDPATGQLVVTVQPVGTSAGELAVQDGRSGRVLRLLSIGRDPVAVTLDARAQRAIVLLPDGQPVSQGTGPLASLRDWSRRWLPWLPLPRTPAISTTGSVHLIPLR